MVNMFWDNVKSELEYQGMQLKEMCIKSDLNYASICNGISKHTTPSVEVAYKIATALNVSVEYLISGNIQEGLSCEETELIRNYRLLDESNKAMIQIMLAAAASEK